MNIESPITTAARRITMLIETGYLPDQLRRDIQILMHGALAYEITTSKEAELRNQSVSQSQG